MPSRKPPEKKQRQRLEVLVEETLTQVRRVAEGHDVLERMISETRRELSTRMEDLESRMNLGFQEMAVRFNRIEMDIRQLKQELSEVKQAVSEVDRHFQDHLKLLHAAS